MADVQAWANQIAQQLFDGPQDLANEAAANVTDASGLAFFVGKPNGSSGQWTLKKLTPTELGKLVYNYLTTQSIAQQLASVLGVGVSLDSGYDLDNIKTVGDYGWGGNDEVAHAPKENSTSHMTVRKHTNGVIFQVVYTGIPAEIYTRSYNGYTLLWSSWARCDNFGCNTLAELKAALANV